VPTQGGQKKSGQRLTEKKGFGQTTETNQGKGKTRPKIFWQLLKKKECEGKREKKQTCPPGYPPSKSLVGVT